MNVEIHPEHQWLAQLVGDWTMEGECVVEAGQPTMKFGGSEKVRMLGETWMIAEGNSTAPNGGVSKSVMTLGFDSDRKRVTGTYINSMMTFLWVYDGKLDSQKNLLELDTQGPSFSPGADQLAAYRDVIELVSPDHRRLTSYLKNANGQWETFMSANYIRIK